jgi:hypothetical protein
MKLLFEWLVGFAGARAAGRPLQEHSAPRYGLAHELPTLALNALAPA